MKKLTYIISLLSITAGLASCENWFDVKPQTQVDADLIFNRESGFKDVLANVYLNMTESNMYGREMTFGMVDILGGVYDEIEGTTNTYFSQYNYNSYTESVTEGIWQSTYNAITNLNYLIERLENADSTMFSDDNYAVISGEALGLRAFLHFDLLRLYAPSCKSAPNAPAIPYVTRYGYTTTEQATVTQVLNFILDDLNEAAKRLKESDPLVTKREVTVTVDDGYLMNREFRFNYYAVKATMARVYMYMNKKSEAAACAEEVIGSGLFNWVSFDNVNTSSLASRDRTFVSEQIFVLQNQRLEDNILQYLYSGDDTYPANLCFSPNALNSIYSYTSDWRSLYLYSTAGQGVQKKMCNKLWQPEKINSDYQYRQPLIRLSEMYLIKAEALSENDPGTATRLVQEMMVNRGELASVGEDTGLPVEELIFQEYRRDFPCEGVMFFYYKRLDKEQLQRGLNVINMDKSKYVLPMPSEEIEFGQRK